MSTGKFFATAAIIGLVFVFMSACSRPSPDVVGSDTMEITAEPPPTSKEEPQASVGDFGENSNSDKEDEDMAELFYQGHGSLRITTAEGKVIYIDPYIGDGYDLPADLILVSHQHSDHNQTGLIETKNPGCTIITEKEALVDGVHQTIDLGYVIVEAVEARNGNHDSAECVGFILTFSDGITIYISGDTSKTTQMESFAERKLDYALLCCDGTYNMDIKEASECAALIKALHCIPYHMAPGKLFDREVAEQFVADGRIIVADGESIALK